MQNQDQPGFIEWYEFGPTKDTFIVSTIPDQTKKTSQTGIVTSTETSVVQDRPFRGIVVSIGPDSVFRVGDYVYFQPTSGFDLAMIKPTKDGEKFILLHTDAILGKKLIDSRNLPRNK